MNEHLDEFKRSVGDLILFGVTFLGFVVGVGGIIIDSGCTALFGFFLMAVCFCCFLLKQE